MLNEENYKWVNEDNRKWGKRHKTDTIWWEYTPGLLGVWVFSFDKVKRFNMYKDYPCKLTKEQKEIFDKENPFRANFFKYRTEEWEKMHKE